ncbi:MAG: STAS domain-containing protein [Saccharofermentans sp.]|nr:STAS domain-containing protein [Saccharofermentans sp.]
MNIKKERKDNSLVVFFDGRLDAIGSPEAEAQLVPELTGITSLGLDFSKVDYVSSAGLRLLLYLDQIMEEQGEMYLTNVPEIVKEIFDVTGFLEYVKIV